MAKSHWPSQPAQKYLQPSPGLEPATLMDQKTWRHALLTIHQWCQKSHEKLCIEVWFLRLKKSVNKDRVNFSRSKIVVIYRKLNSSAALIQEKITVYYKNILLQFLGFCWESGIFFQERHLMFLFDKILKFVGISKYFQFQLTLK